uniref:Retrotransposon gag protein n=1 Tax=Asparagus officinalis TaxID=4686 RepID=Q2AA09_ASPOF|nr:Retrotransposon gag protein [Asparagus officinalis]
MNGVSDDAIKLRLFPFSLRDKARAWLQSLPPGSITTWDQLSEAFLAKYFPPSKTAQLRNQITTFTQKEGESLYDAWERYKDLLRMCPHHGLEDWLIIHTFYNGLLYNTRMTVDAAAGGALMNKSVRDAKQLIEDMAQNHFQWSGERSLPKKSGRYDVDALDHIASRVDALFQKFDKMSMNSVASNSTNCEICGIIGHSAVECQIGNSPSPDAPLSEHVNYMNNFNQKGDPFSNTYNPGWRNHPNLSYKNPPLNPIPHSNFQPPGFQTPRLPYPSP